MADQFVAEIRMFAGNFAPTGWAVCNGQLIPIAQNTALFSLLGTTYGGNGTTNFALPNLQGRAPMHPGQGPSLSPRVLGEQGGEESVTLLASEMPDHNHPFAPVGAAATTGVPTNNVSLAQTAVGNNIYGLAADLQSLGTPSGGSQPHNNMQPYLTLNFIIALQGIFPPRA
jgi:microcystin-dependent protein